MGARSFVIACVLGSLHAAALAATDPLTGFWEIDRVQVLKKMRSMPFTVLNGTVHFDGDGKVCVTGPNQTLDPARDCGRYRRSSSGVEIAIDSFRLVFDDVRFWDDGTASLRLQQDEHWTLRRLSDVDTAYRRRMPRTTYELPGGVGSELPRDLNTYGDLRLPDRLLGTWEEIARCGFPNTALPLDGYRNQTWAFGPDWLVISGQIDRRFVPSGVQRSPPMTYRLEDDGVLRYGRWVWAVSFNEWGQMVLTERSTYGARVFLQRLSREADPMRLPTLKMLTYTIELTQHCPMD